MNTVYQCSLDDVWDTWEWRLPKCSLQQVQTFVVVEGLINFEPVWIQSNPILYCYACNRSLSTSYQMPTTITTTKTTKVYIKLIWIYNQGFPRFLDFMDKPIIWKREKLFLLQNVSQVLIIPFGYVWG